MRAAIRMSLVAVGMMGMALTLAGPAAAVGTGGVEMSVVGPRDPGGRLHLRVTADEPERSVLLTNLTDEQKVVQVYAAGAAIHPDTGAATVEGRGTADWLGFEEQEVVLGPRERVEVPFAVRPHQVPNDGAAHAAIVLESRQGESLVTQAASVFRLTAEEPAPPWLLFLFALAWLLFIAAAVTRQYRKERRERKERTATVGPSVLASA